MKQYNEFVDKFKPRHTSDDTHTPANVYEAVLSWAERRYGLARADVVRPFYPGGDYANAEYSEDCVVLDNPPFSILSKIVRFYLTRKIRFFLFAPSLTSIGLARHYGCAVLFTNSNITFDNGAVVLCAFVTNLENPDILAISEPELGDAIESAEKENRKIGKKKITPLSLPDAVITGARMQYLASHHVPHTVRRSESVFIRYLDNYPSGLYGGGFLLSERAAAERAAALKIELSLRERQLQQTLGKSSTRSTRSTRQTTIPKHPAPSTNHPIL